MITFTKPQEAYPATHDEWDARTRRRIIARFREQIYGRVPEAEVRLSWTPITDGTTLGGNTQRQIGLDFEGPYGATRATVLVTLPKQGSQLPAFLGLNFQGNHACTADPNVLITGHERASETGETHYDHLRETMEVPPARGNKANRWPFDLACDQGHAVVTLTYLQVGPDNEDVFIKGLRPIIATTGMHDRPADECGAIGMWAWTLSRVLDALEGGMVPEIDATRVTVMGHSRLGKTALWAAAQDERFAAAISNNSGCMGAALSRDVGETPEVLARVRPYWFARNFNDTILAGGSLPVDQHQLIACIAPRPVYVASASENHGADPEGEYLALLEAARVWELYGYPVALGAFPDPGDKLWADQAPLGYHLRDGAHSVETFDWEHWLAFLTKWGSQRDSNGD